MILYLFLSAFSAMASVKDLPTDKLTVGLGFGAPKLTVSLIGPSGNKVELEPNVNNQTIVSLNYGHLGISYGFKQEELTNPEFDGVSSYDDYQFRLYYDNLLIEAFYQKYQGYFIKNSNDVVNGENNIKRPNLESTKHFSSFTYTFDSNNFSLNHPYSIDKLQTQSGGSWLLQANITHTTLKNGNEAIIPSTTTNDYGKLNSLNRHSNILISLGPGYGYNLIFGSFYTNLTVLLLPSLQKFAFSYEDGTSDEKDNFDFASGAIKIALGWNTQRYKVGLEGLSDNSSARLETKEQIDSLTLKTAFMFHYRF